MANIITLVDVSKKSFVNILASASDIKELQVHTKYDDETQDIVCFFIIVVKGITVHKTYGLDDAIKLYNQIGNDK